MISQNGSFPRAGWAGWPAAVAMGLAARDYRAGNRDQAARRCRELIARDPWHAEALHMLGTVCLERSQLEEAVVCLDRATRLRPGAAAPFYQLGIALLGR